MVSLLLHLLSSLTNSITRINAWYQLHLLARVCAHGLRVVGLSSVIIEGCYVPYTTSDRYLQKWVNQLLSTVLFITMATPKNPMECRANNRLSIMTHHQNYQLRQKSLILTQGGLVTFT